MSDKEHAISPLQLPHTITFSMTLAEILTKFGKPGFSEMDLGIYRWDFPDHCFFVQLDDKGELFSVGVQLPVKK